jgi:hypothetical protein
MINKYWKISLSITTVILLIIIGLFALGILPPNQDADINENKILTEVAQISTNGETMKVQIYNSIAFVIDTQDDNPGGLMALDISDPLAPTIIGSYYESGLPVKFAIQGDYAYVANRFNGLEILDISDLEHITRVYHHRSGEVIYDIKVKNNLAFVGGEDPGLEILDISDPMNPVQISTAGLDGWGINIEIMDDILIVEDRWLGTAIETYDVSDAANPIYLDEYKLQNVDFFNMHVNGNNLYVADHGTSGDWFIFDLETPTTITQVGRFDSGGTAYGSWVENDIAYIADYSKGLLIVDISDPTNPVLLESHLDGGAGQDVVVSGGYIYFADRHDGLEILQYA